MSLREIKDNMLKFEQQQQTSIHNGVSIEIKQSFQEISSSVNVANLINNKIASGQIQINPNYIPAVMNLELGFNNDQSQKQLLSLLQKNNFLTTVWIQKDTTDIEKLDLFERQQIYISSILDPFIKAVKYANNIQFSQNNIINKLNIKRTFLGFDYDGMTYSTGFSLSQMEIKEFLKYLQQNYFFQDVRKQNFYKNSMITEMPISQQYISPISQVANHSNFGLICQQSGIRKNKLVLCTLYQALNFDLLGENMGKSMQYYLMIDPSEMSIVYHSDIQYNKSNLKLEDFLKSKYNASIASDLSYAIQNQVLQDNSSQQSQLRGDISFDDLPDQYIYKFKDQNDKPLTAIINYLNLYSMKPSNKTQLQQYECMIFIQVYDENIMKEKIESKFKTVYDYILYSTISLSILFFLAMIVLVAFSFRLKNKFDIPIIHLTKVLKKLFKFLNNTNNNLDTLDEEIIDLIDGENSELYFMSKDTELLYSSFKGLFKTLNATNNKLLQLSDENQCNSLMKLIDQLEYFEKFGNYSALGVCHNNIACIHMNQGRFLEALQHFSISIIQAQYELDFYQEKNEQQESIQSPTSSPSPRRTLIRQVSIFDNLNKQRKLINRKQNNFVNKEIKGNQNEETDTNTENEKQELQYFYQKLFNRKFNYINTLILLIRSQSITKYTLSSLHLSHQNETSSLNSSFLNEVDELLLELLIIEQHLQKSNSRTLQILLTRAQVKLDLNQYTEAKKLIKQCKQLFLETQQSLLTAVGLGSTIVDNSPSQKLNTPQAKSTLNLKGQIKIQYQSSQRLNTPKHASPQNKATSFTDEVNQIKQNMRQKSNTFLTKKGNLRKRVTLQKQGSIDRREIDWMLNKSKNQLQVRETNQSIFSPMNETRRLSRMPSNDGHQDHALAYPNYSKSYLRISEIEVEDKETKMQSNLMIPSIQKIMLEAATSNINSNTYLNHNQYQQQDSQTYLNPLNINTGYAVTNQINSDQLNRQTSINIIENNNGFGENNNQIKLNLSHKEINQVGDLQKSFVYNSQNSSLDINHKPIIRNLDMPIHLTRQMYTQQNQQINFTPNDNNNINNNINPILQEAAQNNNNNNNNANQNQQAIQNNLPASEKIYKVKRYVDDEKMIKFEFFPDILRTQLVLVEADLLISKQNYFKAAELLTKNLECSQFYTSHLRSQLIEKLTYVFEISKIDSHDLKEFHQSFNINLSFKIALISASQKSSNQKRTYLFCKDILDELLNNKNDKFGLIINNSFLPVSLQVPLIKISQIKSSSHLIKFHLKQMYREIYKNENSQKNFQRRSCRKGSSLISSRIQNLLQSQQNNSVFSKIFKCFKRLSSRNSSIKSQVFKQRSNQIKKSTIMVTKNPIENESMDINFITETQQNRSEISEISQSISESQNEVSQAQQQIEQGNNSQNGSLYHILIKQSRFTSDGLNHSNLNSNFCSPKILNYQKNLHRLSIFENQRLETSDELALKNKTLVQSPLGKYCLAQSLGRNPIRINSSQKLEQNLLDRRLSIDQNQTDDTNQTPKSNQNQQMKKLNLNTFSSTQQIQNFKQLENYQSFFPLNFQDQTPKPLIQKFLTENDLAIQKKQSISSQTNQINYPKQQQNRKRILRHKSENFNNTFHFCVRKSIIDIILNGKMQNKDYLVQQKFSELRNEEMIRNIQKLNESSIKQRSIYQQNYLITEQRIIVFVCDEQKTIIKDQKYKSLIKLLYYFKILLIVLQLNEKESQKEKVFSDDEYFNKTQVIMFFYSEERLLQYLYNKRDKPICNSQPLIYEHFQTVFFIIIFKL